MISECRFSFPPDFAIGTPRGKVKGTSCNARPADVLFFQHEEATEAHT